VISGSRHGVNKMFALLGYYAAWIGRYRRFGTTYPSSRVEQYYQTALMGGFSQNLIFEYFSKICR